MKSSTKIPFEELRDLLISEGKRFDRDSLRRLSYDALLFASIRNAESAICGVELTNNERKRRLRNCINNPIDKLRNVSESDFMAYDLFCFKADMDGLCVDWQTAPQWLQLYHTMNAFYRLPIEMMFKDKAIIPGKWEDIETTLYPLLQEQVKEVANEGIMPTGWTSAVQQNLNDYIGNRRIPSSILIRGRAKLGLESVEGYEGATEELFHKILSPSMQLQAATRFENSTELVFYKRYFLEFSD